MELHVLDTYEGNYLQLSVVMLIFILEYCRGAKLLPSDANTTGGDSCQLLNKSSAGQ